MSGAAPQSLSPALIHDLRTPLGQIIGYAELLAERAEDAGDERLLPDLRKISAAGYQILALIEEHFTAAPVPRPAAVPFTWDDVDLLRDLGGESDRAAELAARIAALLPARQ